MHYDLLRLITMGTRKFARTERERERECANLRFAYVFARQSRLKIFVVNTHVNDLRARWRLHKYA